MFSTPRDSVVSRRDHMDTGSRSSDVRRWTMILHFSVFASYIIPFVGAIAPLMIWQLKKSQMPEIDAHGKIVVNAMISFAIYFVVSVLLALVIIGSSLLIAIGVIAISFPVIGGIKANHGVTWRYPLTISFFK